VCVCVCSICVKSAAKVAAVVGPRWLILGGLGGVCLCVMAFAFIDPLKKADFFVTSLCIRAVQGTLSGASITSGTHGGSK
jgi:hypothetical protein